MINENTDIKDLKVLAYDLISQLERTQNSLQKVNQLIAQKENKKPPEKAPK